MPPKKKPAPKPPKTAKKRGIKAAHKKQALVHRDGTTYSTHEQLLRTAFVNEMLVDFNPVNAALRCGQKGGYGKLLILETWVARELRRRLAELEPYNIVSRQQVFAGLMAEATRDSNSGLERIMAWERIGKMLGMFTERLDVNVTNHTGVMLLPAQDMGSWETMAAKTQTELKAKAEKLAASAPKVIDINAA